MSPRADSPGILVPPLLVYIAFLLAGLGLERLARIPFPGGDLPRAIGLVLIAGGLVVVVWTLVTFVLARVNPVTFMPAKGLLVRGPFRLSRNPIYLGGLAAYIGTGLIARSLWVLLLGVVLVWVMDRYIIAREESYLLRAFGEEYRGYSARVRRWL